MPGYYCKCMTHCLSVSPPPSTGFKWLGSLSNLSFRRGSSSDKSPSKPDGGRSLDVVSSPDVAETSVDDMDMTRPRTSSYARSSDNYTHMGTLPRLLLRKRDKSGNSVKAGTKKGQGCWAEVRASGQHGTMSVALPFSQLYLASLAPDRTSLAHLYPARLVLGQGPNRPTVRKENHRHVS